MTPLLSFIVLSYNYEKYIGQTLASALSQTVTDLEVVVVDDASSDRSTEVVAAIGDPRVRLHRNETNLGGAASYNRAVELARGEFLVNLDADDWTDPLRCERQLAEFRANHRLDVVGTFVGFVGADGERHPAADEYETYTNHSLDLNRVDSWIVQNPLCRSSTMMRRQSHLRIGLDDPDMSRAPDFELWTRALREGCRFAIVPEKLTSYRLHSRGVTHADPEGTLLEIGYLMRRNLMPLIHARALYPSFTRMLEWHTQHPAFLGLTAPQRYRLVGYLAEARPEFDSYQAFRSWLLGPATEPNVERSGRNSLALMTFPPEAARLAHDAREFMAGRDWWKEQADRLSVALTDVATARDWWRGQAESWEAECKQRDMNSSYREAGLEVDPASPQLPVPVEVTSPRSLWHRLGLRR